MLIKCFTFNPFQENTYILSDSTRECIIIDPGCFNASERNEISDYIQSNGLQPVKLINTHCHIDHILGNKFIKEKYNLQLGIHPLEVPILGLGEASSKMWSVPYETSPQPDYFIEEGETINFGESILQVLFTPGHSPGSICFYSETNRFVISGDVLFYGSIGRTDLPGGNHETLIKRIKTQLFPLGDDLKVYSGHGPATTIGFEKMNNPFLV